MARRLKFYFNKLEIPDDLTIALSIFGGVKVFVFKFVVVDDV